MTQQRIIISRTDSIGDVVLTLPMASLLKKVIPGCTVIFLGSSYTRDIVACCPDVDEFYDWKQTELADIHADTIIHVLPRPEIAKAAKKAKIKLRIGTTNRLYHWWTCNKLVKLSRKKSDLHEAQLNLKLLTVFEGVKDLYSLDDLIKYRVHHHRISLNHNPMMIVSKYCCLNRNLGKIYLVENFQHQSMARPK